MVLADVCAHTHDTKRHRQTEMEREETEKSFHILRAVLLIFENKEAKPSWLLQPPLPILPKRTSPVATVSGSQR